MKLIPICKSSSNCSLAHPRTYLIGPLKELREEFLKQIVTQEFREVRIYKGILISDDWQSTEGDFLWLKSGARSSNMKIYELNDCRMFMEIKSHTTATELKAINSVAYNMKQRYNGNGELLVGMFCYSTAATEKTILKKFGFKYDKDLMAYSTYNNHLDIMENVDFLFSLNITEDGLSSPYFITRDISKECVLYQGGPVIRHFFNYFSQT